MVGFIKGFFGTKPKPDVVEVEQPKTPDTTSASKQEPKAFFLDPDDAKTFGNIEYMRSTKTIRRTFPKTKANGGEFDFVQKVSALEAVKSESKEVSSPSAEVPAPQSTSQKSNQDVSRPVVTDTNLDMFRRMARDIKKR
jgi:hypothetical protein